MASSYVCIFEKVNFMRVSMPQFDAVGEPHYTPQFLAEWLRLSQDTIVRWFQDEKGVLKIGKPSRNGKRTRIELRIPHSVFCRVYQERCN